MAYVSEVLHPLLLVYLRLHIAQLPTAYDAELENTLSRVSYRIPRAIRAHPRRAIPTAECRGGAGSEDQRRALFEEDGVKLHECCLHRKRSSTRRRCRPRVLSADGGSTIPSAQEHACGVAGS